VVRYFGLSPKFSVASLFVRLRPNFWSQTLVSDKSVKLWSQRTIKWPDVTTAQVSNETINTASSAMRTGSGAGSDVDMADMVLNAEVNCPPRMLVGGSSAGLCSKVIVSSAACQHVAICTALKGEHVQCQVVACTTHTYCQYKKLVGVSKHVCRYGSNCSRQPFTVVCSRKLDRSPSLVLTASP